ncbi:MAG: polysaccharide deacetylase family protein [Actinomycetes bacterium]|jgi:peptidoglycan/xylan/chitin deacetylase (PgdA/CDA1 family)|nr:polysaccharide deacetylase family protein [Actinomycetes bacterium]
MTRAMSSRQSDIYVGGGLGGRDGRGAPLDLRGTGGAGPSAGGRRPGSRRWLLIIGALAVFVLAWMFGPRLLSLSVPVRLNGETYKVKTGTPVTQFIDDHLNVDEYTGDLLAIDGSPLKINEGETPVVTVNGRPAAKRATVKAHDVVVVTMGADRTEPITENSTLVQPKLSRNGHGQMIEVTDTGQVGVKVTPVGDESGLQAPTEVRTKAKAVKLRQVNAWKVRPKVVALTFDDGPNPGETESVLKILAREQVPATFFMVGSSAKAYPKLVKAVADGGHQLALHGFTHKSLDKLKSAEVESELKQTAEAIEEVTGARPDWLRPPYGAVNASVYSLLGEQHTKVALWSVDPHDYQKPGAKAIASRVVDGVGPGSIVLLHDGGGDRKQTVAAVEVIIKKLKQKGYRFVTIQQMWNLSQ